MLCQEITEQKLVKMHQLCEKERCSQREVVDTAHTVGLAAAGPV